MKWTRFILFFGHMGNTENMSAIGAGVKEAGKEPVFLSPSEANIEDLKMYPHLRWVVQSWEPKF